MFGALVIHTGVRARITIDTSVRASTRFFYLAVEGLETAGGDALYHLALALVSPLPSNTPSPGDWIHKFLNIVYKRALYMIKLPQLYVMNRQDTQGMAFRG